MSEYSTYVSFLDYDFEVVYEADFGADYRDGDFEMYITEIYADVNMTKKFGANLYGEFMSDDIEELEKQVMENSDFFENAAEEQLCRGDYLYELRRDADLDNRIDEARQYEREHS